MIELRNQEDARRFLLQGFWWQRVEAPAAANVRLPLEWAHRLLSSGSSLPPLGFIADLGLTTLRTVDEQRKQLPLDHLPTNVVRTYEDRVLGKFYADWSFERSAEAIRRYANPVEKAKGVSYILARFLHRGNYTGVNFSPGILSGMLTEPPEDLLKQGLTSLEQGLDELNMQLYEGLIQSSRRTPEVLGQDDVLAVEARDALVDEGEQVARRQVRQAALLLEKHLPACEPTPFYRQRITPTNILVDDTYPIGGFNSISTRGTVESLLHSQLAYMEENSDGPDLFDIKFLRDELLYYSRDENQFLRKRRSFVFILHDDLVNTRYKDKELPYQRGVMLLGWIYTCIKKLSEWLSTDALEFSILFVKEEDKEVITLQKELDLLKILLKDHIENKAVIIDILPLIKIQKYCEDKALKSLLTYLHITTEHSAQCGKDVNMSMQIPGPVPELFEEDSQVGQPLDGDEMDHWKSTLEYVLRNWI